MRNLATAVIDHWMWILHCEDELKGAFGEDFMLDHFYEGIGSTLDDLDPDEMQALRSVAAERLQSHEDQSRDEWGFPRGHKLRNEEHELLTSIVNWGLGTEEEGTAPE